MATKTTTTDQDARAHVLRATRDQIHRALPGPKGVEWSTAQAIADVVGKGYSTVTENLRAMAVDGRVESRKLGRNTVWRRLVAAPKLTKTDVPTPRAATVAQSHDVRALAPPKRRRATVTRDVETVELPPADVEPNDEPIGDGVLDAEIVEADGDMVWMAVKRKGLNYHKPAYDGGVSPAVPHGVLTVCGRSMRTGVFVPLAEVRDTSPMCPDCVRRAAAAPSEPVTVPQPPPAANTPTGGDVGAVVDYLEAQRPVSAPPAEPVQKARRPKAETKTYAVFGRGKLQDAILTHVQALAPADATPYQVATALNAYPGAVAYGLGRLVVKGNVRVTSDKPQRYAAV